MYNDNGIDITYHCSFVKSEFYSLLPTRNKSVVFFLEIHLITNPFSAGQEIPLILWNQEVQYCIHTCPSTVPILSQLDSFHNPLPEDTS
jgi:hypothetical protein